MKAPWGMALIAAWALCLLLLGLRNLHPPEGYFVPEDGIELAPHR